MLRLGNERDQLSIVCDQIGAPTPADELARACLIAAERLNEDASLSGLYHFCGEGAVSWAEFAREIFRLTGMNTEIIEILTREFPTRAVRPLNSCLDCFSLSRLGLKQPDWRAALARVVETLT